MEIVWVTKMVSNSVGQSHCVIYKRFTRESYALDMFLNVNLQAFLQALA